MNIKNMASDTNNDSKLIELDFKNLTDFQKELHTKNENKDNTEEEEKLISNFVREFRKTSWFMHYTKKMEYQSSGPQITYFPNMIYHLLLDCCMIQYFQAIRVKDDFRNKIQIAWPRNVGTNTVVSATFKINEDIIDNLDPIWQDMRYQHYRQVGFDHYIEESLGNTYAQWTTEIPAFTTIVQQPWFYTKELSLAFPLCLTSNSTKVLHTYQMRRRVADVLRMRELQADGEWKDIPCDISKLDGVGAQATLRIPELWADYAVLSEEELEWMKCADKKDYYIETIKACKSTNRGKLGQSVEVKISGDTPCKAIFWVAENIKCRKINNYSNYTINPNYSFVPFNNLSNGYNPCKRVSLGSSSLSRFENYDSDLFAGMYYKHFPAAPKDKGYNVYPISLNTTSLDAEIGLVPSKYNYSLFIKLSNSNPRCIPIRNTDPDDISNIDFDKIVEELDPDEVRLEDRYKNDEFDIHVRLLLTRKLTFYKSKNDNKNYRFALDCTDSHIQTLMDKN
jgi:hypothetical protein